ncbi:MAG TPA: hypothetical protein VFA78_09460 [Chloroflexota bacterium]|nr:hypothetical protein [Chloroflexota bacterium]
MTHQTQRSPEGAMTDPFHRALSRRQLLAAAAAGVALAALPASAGAEGGVYSFPYFPSVTSGSYSTETIQEILDAVVTPHYLAATGATMTLANAAALGFTGWELSMQQAAAAREQYQIDFLSSLGATPAAIAFTFPPGFFSARPMVLATAEGATSILIAAQMTAAREFAELGQPTVAKWMYQMGTQAAEQRAIFRTLRAIDGVAAAVPPNNKAFATDLFLYTRDVIGVIKALGLIGGSAPAVSYPGRDAVLAAAGPMADAILQKRPNDANSTAVITGPGSVNGERS